MLVVADNGGAAETTAAKHEPGNLRGDGDDRYPAAVTVVQPVDQVQLAGPALPEHTASRSATCASAAAAKATASSWRTSTR